MEQLAARVRFRVRKFPVRQLPVRQLPVRPIAYCFPVIPIGDLATRKIPWFTLAAYWVWGLILLGACLRLALDP